MKTITVLTDTGSGILARCQINVTPCPSADTGWGITTIGAPEPINTTTMTNLWGWGNESGSAVVHNGLRIPLDALT